ncbi:MAG TPA: LysM peptidoglycan-binding domain-containing protein [Candidatus Gallacutalibacter pullistercoris]|nr:LysM peptidoglycan-binding domain-containing protein [Candidatus Gallacutalibacter pullistercoris]
MVSVYYRVKAGESLLQIARRYKTTPEELIRLNGLKTGGVVTEGSRIRIPVQTAQKKPENNLRWIVVYPEETIAQAARRSGISIELLCWLNGLRPDTRLYAGQRLQIRP